MTKRSLNKIVEKANDNTSMKEFVILKTTKQMIELMIMKTMSVGWNTINLWKLTFSVTLTATKLASLTKMTLITVSQRRKLL
jgi:uncharacterized membrane protein